MTVCRAQTVPAYVLDGVQPAKTDVDQMAPAASVAGQMARTYLQALARVITVKRLGGI
jgi:hypothetical protein